MIIMTKYQEWITAQSAEFIKTVHKKEIPAKYMQEDWNGITLEQLAELDDKFINNPEGE